MRGVYTSGGMPVWFSGLEKRKPLRTRNKRYPCRACPAKTTKNQLKLNGCVCHACKAPNTR